MSIYTKQQQYEKKVKNYGKLLNSALNGLNGSFQITTASYNVNVRIRANRNIDKVITLLNERNNNIDLYKTYENENMVLYQGYVKKDEYI